MARKVMSFMVQNEELLYEPIRTQHIKCYKCLVICGYNKELHMTQVFGLSCICQKLYSSDFNSDKP